MASLLFNLISALGSRLITQLGNGSVSVRICGVGQFAQLTWRTVSSVSTARFAELKSDWLKRVRIVCREVKQYKLLKIPLSNLSPISKKIRHSVLQLYTI